MEENEADVGASSSSSPQICSQLTERLERQQAAHAEELEALKVQQKLLLLLPLASFTLYIKGPVCKMIFRTLPVTAACEKQEPDCSFLYAESAKTMETHSG